MAAVNVVIWYGGYLPIRGRVDRRHQRRFSGTPSCS
jgi:hypothetical protein